MSAREPLRLGDPMTAAESTPLEAAGFAYWKHHMHVGTWADQSPQDRAYHAQQAAKIVGPALAGDWLERVLAEHGPWATVEEGAECECGELFAAIGEYAPPKHRAHLADEIRKAATR